DVAHDLAAAERDGEGGCGDEGFAHRFILTRISSSTGPPMSAVMTPTGINVPTCGLPSRNRATASASTSTAAPIAAETGSSRRLSGPTIHRAACGQISPTNPIGPLIATAAAVTSEATRRPTHRTRFTCAPRDAA